MNHSTITMIKTEPLSEDVNVTVVDDEQDARGITSKAGVTRQQQQKPRKRVQNQLQQTTSATAAAAAQASKMQQHTIRLSRVS